MSWNSSRCIRLTNGDGGTATKGIDGCGEAWESGCVSEGLLKESGVVADAVGVLVPDVGGLRYEHW
jgi:hypothetical protein